MVFYCTVGPARNRVSPKRRFCNIVRASTRRGIFVPGVIGNLPLTIAAIRSSAEPILFAA